MPLLDNLGKTLANLPFVKRALLSPRFEPPNVSTSAEVSAVQSMIRAAEGGDPGRLFSYYRDLTLSGSHVQSEFAKRKLALLGDACAILPANKTNADDLRAAQAIRQCIADCENWLDGLIFLQDSCLYPVSVIEHLFKVPDPQQSAGHEVPLRYTLKRFEPVNYALLSFRANYYPLPNLNPEAPDQWEPELRFWSVNATSGIDRDVSKTYPCDPLRHIVHRCHLLVGVRDNWGGPMRAIVFWHLLAILGRDWFARLMERYGNPFIVGKTDKTDKDGVEFLKEALSLSTKIGGLVVDTETEIELKEAMLSGAADGYEKFLGVCNREISKVIVGQDLSAQSAPTGLGSGVAALQAGVRQDIRMFDQVKLAETLEKQLFARLLRVNGIAGATPKIRWGGLSVEEAKETGALLVNLTQSNLEPTDEAIQVITEKIGFGLQRKAAAPPPGQPGQLPAAFRARLATYSSQVKIADNLGVPPAWLNPLRDFLAELENKATDQTLSEKDLLNFLDAALARVPELFRDMDVEELAKVLEAGMGQAVVDAVRQGVKQGKS